MNRIRIGTASWIAAGLAIAAYPVVRPAGDTGAERASVAWTAGHVLAVAGFGLLVAGLAALWSELRGRPGERTAFAAVVAGGAGAVLVLPYYGAETFALTVLADRGLPDPLGDAIRYQPAAATTFVAGLLALAVASVLAAAALRNAAQTRAGWLLVAGFVLYLPQFFAPYPLRMVHGLLVMVGCLVIARHLAAVPAPGRPRPVDPVRPAA